MSDNIVCRAVPFERKSDIFELGIVDFNRLNGYWPDIKSANHTISSILMFGACYSIIDIDYTGIPERDDFPGWDHVGRHEGVGKSYWDWFKFNHPAGELVFSDSPDFFGSFDAGRRYPVRFMGDVGMVSASAFAMAQKQAGIGDLWISVLCDGARQVVIEYKINVAQAVWCDDPRDPSVHVCPNECCDAARAALNE